MISRTRLTYLLAAFLPLSGSGCIVAGNWGLGWGEATVWTSETTERLPIDTPGLKALEVRTHNGPISFDDQPAGSSEAYVVFTKKGGGRTQTEADEACEAIETFAKPLADGKLRIGWKWNKTKRHYWKAHVGIEIHAPGKLGFDGETHNGPVAVRGVSGDVHLVTHNGRIEVDSEGGRLYSRTHNGKVVARYAGGSLALISHNGHVTADLGQCGVLDGNVTTHNGGIEVVLGESTSSRLECNTHHGAIRFDVPELEWKFSRRTLTGKIGDGEGNLDLTTHNGSIRVSTNKS